MEMGGGGGNWGVCTGRKDGAGCVLCGGRRGGRKNEGANSHLLIFTEFGQQVDQRVQVPHTGTYPQ